MWNHRFWKMLLTFYLLQNLYWEAAEARPTTLSYTNSSGLYKRWTETTQIHPHKETTLPPYQPTNIDDLTNLDSRPSLAPKYMAGFSPNTEFHRPSDLPTMDKSSNITEAVNPHSAESPTTEKPSNTTKAVNPRPSESPTRRKPYISIITEDIDLRSQDFIASEYYARYMHNLLYPSPPATKKPSTITEAVDHSSSESPTPENQSMVTKAVDPHPSESPAPRKPYMSIITEDIDPRSQDFIASEYYARYMHNLLYPSPPTTGKPSIITKVGNPKLQLSTMSTLLPSYLKNQVSHPHPSGSSTTGKPSIATEVTPLPSKKTASVWIPYQADNGNGTPFDQIHGLPSLAGGNNSTTYVVNERFVKDGIAYCLVIGVYFMFLFLICTICLPLCKENVTFQEVGPIRSRPRPVIQYLTNGMINIRIPGLLDVTPPTPVQTSN